MHAFLETSSANKVLLAIRRAMEWEYPSLVVSPPGMGKTTALKHYAQQLGGTYIEVDETTKSPGGLYHTLIKAFIGYRQGKTLREDADQLGRYLDRRESDPQLGPLIVDEQQTFEAATLRELLRIAERSNIPLVLAGNNERLARIRKSDQAALAQIESRIGHRVTLGPPDPGDCRSFGVEYNVEGRDAYDALAAFGGKTNVRALVRLLAGARDVVGYKGSLRLRHLEMALIAIYGTRDALKLLLSVPADA